MSARVVVTVFNSHLVLAHIVMMHVVESCLIWAPISDI